MADLQSDRRSDRQHVPNNTSTGNPALRAFFRALARLFLAIFTRTTVTGQENIPARGPLLILGNHTSTIDPMLLQAFLPVDSEFVGPGDFKLLFPANVIIKLYGLVPVKRSTQMDRATLKLMSDMLNSGHMLGLFPDGGSWEKPITDAKSGAAYLSMSTQSPVLPVGIGGAYQVWYKIARLQRPRLIVNFGKVLPAIQPTQERGKRAAALDAATQDIQQHIYVLLPPEDQARYDDLARRQYEVQIGVWRGDSQETVGIPGSSVLGELMLKPNLFSPLIHNAGLPLDPLRFPEHRFQPRAVRLAATSLQRALHTNFADYMEYRLGPTKAAQLYEALDALAALADQPGIAQMRLTPESHVPAGE